MAEITNNIELSIFASIILFFVAALAEIGGGGILCGSGYVKEKDLSLDCLAESFYSFMELFPRYNPLTLEEYMLHMAEFLLYLQSSGDSLWIRKNQIGLKL